MKKTILQGAAVMALFASSFSANAQAQVLNFPKPTDEVRNDHEFGYSSVEFNGYSAFGTEFNQDVQVYKNGQYLFTAAGPLSSGFGHSIGMNQDWIAVGANKHDASPNDGNIYSNEGGVYLSKSVYGNHQNNFNSVITSQTPAANDFFGESIDLDGQWMVVGAHQNYGGGGYIEIWKQTNTGWERKHNIKPAGLSSSAKFGTSVAIKGDYIIVGAPGEKKVYVYKNTNNVWSLLTTYSPNLSTWGKPQYNYDGSIYAYESLFGFDVDITYGYAIVGDPKAEKAAIFSINGSQFTQTNLLLPPANTNPTITFYGEFGHSVAIQYNRALVGAPISAYPNDYGSGYIQGNVFFYTDGYVYKGKMYVGTPSGLIVRGLGRSVAIDSDNVLAGAEYTDNLTYNRYNLGAAFRMPFWHVYQTGNLRTVEDLTEEVVTSTIYPNPATGEEVTCNLSADILSVQAISATGSISNLSFNDKSINVSALESGVYQLIIKTKEGQISERFMK